MTNPRSTIEAQNIVRKVRDELVPVFTAAFMKNRPGYKLQQNDPRQDLPSFLDGEMRRVYLTSEEQDALMLAVGADFNNDFGRGVHIVVYELHAQTLHDGSEGCGLSTTLSERVFLQGDAEEFERDLRIVWLVLLLQVLNAPGACRVWPGRKIRSELFEDLLKIGIRAAQEEINQIETVDQLPKEEDVVDQLLNQGEEVSGE